MSSVEDKKYRNWFFRISAPSMEESISLIAGRTDKCYKYLDWKSQLDSEGVDVIWGYLELYGPRKEEGVRSSNSGLARAALELRRCKREVARKYLYNAEVPKEQPVTKLPSMHNNVPAVEEAIRSGCSLEEILTKFTILNGYEQCMQNCLDRCEPARVGKPEVIWYYGNAIDSYHLKDEKDFIVLDGGRDNWDGYDGHRTVILKNLTTKLASPIAMAHILGFEPCAGAQCLVKSNGYVRQLRATRIIILTQDLPNEVLGLRYKLALKQVEKRIPLYHSAEIVFDIEDEAPEVGWNSHRDYSRKK